VTVENPARRPLLKLGPVGRAVRSPLTTSPRSDNDSGRDRYWKAAYYEQHRARNLFDV
jgi:hypothetical protein